MVSKFLFLLDGQYVDDPKGWEDLDTTIKRDQALSGILISQEAQLEFYGNGYDYIKTQFDSQGFCFAIEIEIRQTCDQINYTQIFKGVIYLSDCVFDLERCSVKVKTVDDGFYARINNNKSIKAKLDVGRSKNDIAITPCTSFAVEFFDPFDGIYDTTNKPHVFTAFDVFRFLVSFMSDGAVDFVSDIFDTGGEWEGRCITIGSEVRLWDEAVIPELSFQEVFTELNKKKRLGFSVEKINGRPTLRIEEAEYFFGQTTATTLPDAKSVTCQMDTSQLYSQVHLGSSITDDTIPPTGEFPESIAFVGFKDETYHIIGQCNVDRTLELNSSWIISSNIIQLIFVRGVDTYDSDIILVDVDMATNKAVQTNWLNVGSFVYYNEVFNNQNTVTRWLGGIPNSIAHYLGNADDTFLASSTADTGLITATFPPVSDDILIQFDNDYTSPNHDAGNNYGNGTVQGNPVSLANSRYTAPAAGVYTLDVSIKLQISGFGDFICWGLWYDASDTFIGILTFGTLNDATGSKTLTGSYTVNMAQGDYVKINLNYAVSFVPLETSFTYYIKAGSTFSCSATNTGGGEYFEIDPSQYKIKKYTFKYPMTFDQLTTIKADTKKLITFTTNNNVQHTGWIDTIKYYHHNKVADITLISN